VFQVKHTVSMIDTDQLYPFQLHIAICKGIIKKVKKFTVHISYLSLILEPISFDNAKIHRYPAAVWDVNTP
jgi:hypothetical protein